MLLLYANNLAQEVGLCLCITKGVQSILVARVSKDSSGGSPLGYFDIKFISPMLVQHEVNLAVTLRVPRTSKPPLVLMNRVLVTPLNLL